MSENINILNEEELNYIMNSNYKVDFPELEKSMKTPRFTINDLAVTARDATYWDKKEILPELDGKQTTRRKYTLKQAIWIKLIQQLRSFDVSLSQIKKIKGNLLQPNVNVLEMIESGGLDAILKSLTERDGQYEEYKALMKDPEFLKEMSNTQLDIFELMIFYVIVFRRDASYLTFADGSCLPYTYEKHNIMRAEIPDFDLLMKTPHITLSISTAYQQLIQDWSEKKWFDQISLVTKDEKKILALIRKNDIKELRIMKNENVIDRVICTKNITTNNLEEFANHLVKNGFQTMTLITRLGKPVHFKNEVSYKLTDIPE